MKIKPQYKVRHVADEDIVLVQGRNPGDLTTVIALNSTSLFLWNSLAGRQFELPDVVDLLVRRFEVSTDRASADAQQWIDQLRQSNILE